MQRASLIKLYKYIQSLPFAKTHLMTKDSGICWRNHCKL